jgi:hypothetical protein
MDTRQIKAIINTHRTKTEKDRVAWDKYRSWYLSDYWTKNDNMPTGSGEHSDAGEVTFETNYLYSYVDTMIANVCPTNPQVTVNARRPEKREAATFREALINEIFRQNDLHTKLWKASTHAAICSRGFAKTIWDFRKQRAITRVIDPRYVWFDMSVPFEDTRYLIEVTVLTKSEMQKRIKKKGPGKGQHYSSKVAEKAIYGGYPAWLRDTSKDKSMIDDASKEVFEWVVVYEFYDFIEEKFYHLIDEVEEPLFEGDLPYRLVKNPFRLLTFNDNMTDSGGVADAKLVEGNIERLNEIDTLELWHAHSTIPVTTLNEAAFDNVGQFEEMLANVDRPGMVARASLTNGFTMNDAIGQTPVPPFTPAFGEMRQRAIDTIEFVLGIPAYSRGKVGVTDVATEAALADTAVRTRNGRRIKAVLDLVSGIGEDIMALYEEFMPADQDIPVRLTGKSESIAVNRKNVAARNPEEDTGGVFDFDYEATAYSPTENHRLLQLEKLKQYMPLLSQHPAIDPEKLFRTLLDMLQLPDLMVDQSKQAAAFNQNGPPGAGAPMPGGMVPPAAPGGPQGPDTIASGALPPGQEPINMPLPGGGPGSGQRMA